jgi:CubicO group peptidase (beta-lactamase class C family)
MSRSLSARQTTVVVVLSVVALVASACNSVAAPDEATAPHSYEQTVADGRTAANAVVADDVVSSVSVALVDDENVVWSEAFGDLDREAGTTVDPATRYGIGSVSKVISTVAVMKLVDQGKVALDDPLISHVPGFRMASPEYRDITVRMLLDHSAGFPGTDYRNGFTFEPIPGYAAQVQETLATSRLKGEPGEFSVYCNDCFTMVEPLVQAVTGKALIPFVQEEIFTPLGMTRSGYETEPLAAGTVARTHSGDTVKPQELTNVYASGGVLSTPSDMGRLATMFMNGGKVGNTRILSEESVAKMGGDLVHPREFDPMPTAYGGLGWDLTEEPGLSGVKAWAKSGGTIDYYTYFMVAPAEKLAVVVSAAGGGDVHTLARRIMRQALAERGIIAAGDPPAATAKPVTDATDADLASMVGWYAGGSSLYRVVAQPDRSLTITQFETGSSTDLATGLKLRDDGTWTTDEEPGTFYHLMTGLGNRYLAQGSTDGAGQDLGDMPIAQRVEPRTALSAVWQQRVGTTWLSVNEHPSSAAMALMAPVLTLSTVDGFDGYLFVSTISGSQLVDTAGSDTVGRMSLKVPVNAGRDMNDLVIESVGGEEQVVFGSTRYRSEATVPGLATGANTVTVAADELTQWRRVPQASALTMTGSGSWRLFGGDGDPIASGTGAGEVASAPEGSFLMVGGPRATSLDVTVTPAS